MSCGVAWSRLLPSERVSRSSSAARNMPGCSAMLRRFANCASNASMVRVIIGLLLGRGAWNLLKRALFAAGLTLAFAGCSLLPRSEPAPSVANIPERTQGSVPAPPAPAQRPDPAAAMVGAAWSMLGQPYRYGGAAPGGFDCSGLVEFSAASAGMRVPRTAHEQLGSGRPVERAQVRAGDLVFMRLARKELHVGIAIDGARFIHAPASGGHVRIDSLDTAPYSRGFLGARRIAD